MCLLQELPAGERQEALKSHDEEMKHLHSHVGNKSAQVKLIRARVFQWSTVSTTSASAQQFRLHVNLDRTI